MNIVLIKPKWPAPRQSITPPLGLMYLASYVRKNLVPKPTVTIIEQAVDDLSLADIERKLLDSKPDVVGITALTFEAPSVKLLAELSKKLFPNVPVIVGGPHATVFFDHILDNTVADVTVQGEGEETFLEFCRRVQNGADWRDIPGISHRGENSAIIKNSERPAIMDLDSIPFPAWDLVNIPRYCKHSDMNNYVKTPPYMAIFTSRACPFGCIYCHQTFGKKFRARSVENVLEEIRVLNRDFGVNELQVIDDVFNWDVDRAKNICKGIINEGIRVNISFPNGIRGDKLDDELLELLAKAGCFAMTFAVETASPRLQKLIHKNADLDKIMKAVEKADSLGIIPMGFFMLGFPTETVEEMEATIDWACKSKILKAIFFNVVPFPRTKLADLFKETYPNDFNLDDYSPDNMHYFTTDPFYKRVTGIEVDEILRKAYRRFYLDPTRVYKILARFDWNTGLLRGGYHAFQAVWKGGKFIDELWSKIVRKKLGMNDAGAAKA